MPRPSDALSNQLLEMYYFARLARDVEERLVILFRQSKVIGGLYRSLGQEEDRSRPRTRSSAATRFCR